MATYYYKYVFYTVFSFHIGISVLSESHSLVNNDAVEFGSMLSLSIHRSECQSSIYKRTNSYMF